MCGYFNLLPAMKEISFNVKEGLTEKWLEQWFASVGLDQTMKGKLKSLPENTHWHLKLSGQPGVCEVTLLRATNEIIINSKKNRHAAWIDETAQKLKNALLI